MDTNNAPEDDKTATKRFLFDVSFDVEEKHAAEEEPSEDEPPEPVFTLEQVEDARQQGYREGREAGIADAANGVEIEVRNLLQQIGEFLPGIAAEQTTANELLMRDGAEVAVTIVRKLMPTTIEPQSIKEIEALVSDCLERLTHQPKISIRVAEQHVAAIEAHLDEAVATKGFDGRFLVEAEDGLAPTDCRVTWPSGGAERNLDAIWQDIEADGSRRHRPDGQPGGHLDVEGLMVQLDHHRHAVLSADGRGQVVMDVESAGSGRGRREAQVVQPALRGQHLIARDEEVEVRHRSESRVSIDASDEDGALEHDHRDSRARKGVEQSPEDAEADLVGPAVAGVAGEELPRHLCRQTREVVAEMVVEEWGDALGLRRGEDRGPVPHPARTVDQLSPRLGSQRVAGGQGQHRPVVRCASRVVRRHRGCPRAGGIRYRALRIPDGRPFHVTETV